MGRPPSNGGPAFRFNQAEVAEMEAILRENDNLVPKSDVLAALSDKFSQSAERAGKVPVQIKQVWNWFQNRRYALRAKVSKPPGKLAVTSMPAVDPARHVTQTLPVQPALAGRSVSENPQMEFEAKSARDGAWYDVQAFLSHRHLETGDPEVFVRFAGFGPEEDEWINIHRHVRQRSLPCESTECVAVLPGDLILCFQEGREQALYFDAHVLDAQRRRHDIRGCRCRFLVRYDHDQSEEIVPLRKVCRRPETDYRLHQLHSTANNLTPATDQLHAGSTTLKAANRLNEAGQASPKSVVYPIIPGATVSGQISMPAAPPVNFATEIKKVESGNPAVCSNTATGASMAAMNETTTQ